MFVIRGNEWVKLKSPDCWVGANEYGSGNEERNDERFKYTIYCTEGVEISNLCDLMEYNIRLGSLNISILALDSPNGIFLPPFLKEQVTRLMIFILSVFIRVLANRSSPN